MSFRNRQRYEQPDSFTAPRAAVLHDCANDRDSTADAPAPKLAAEAA